MNRAMALANGFSMGNAFKDVLFRRTDCVWQTQPLARFEAMALDKEQPVPWVLVLSRRFPL